MHFIIWCSFLKKLFKCFFCTIFFHVYGSNISLKIISYKCYVIYNCFLLKSHIFHSFHSNSPISKFQLIFWLIHLNKIDVDSEKYFKQRSFIRFTKAENKSINVFKYNKRFIKKKNIRFINWNKIEFIDINSKKNFSWNFISSN